MRCAIFSAGQPTAMAASLEPRGAAFDIDQQLLQRIASVEQPVAGHCASPMPIKTTVLVMTLFSSWVGEERVTSEPIAEKSGSQQTPRWREVDSNSRSHLNEKPFRGR